MDLFRLSKYKYRNFILLLNKIDNIVPITNTKKKFTEFTKYCECILRYYIERKFKTYIPNINK